MQICTHGCVCVLKMQRGKPTDLKRETINCINKRCLQ